MGRRKFTLVPIWLTIAALSSGAWATRAGAQTDERRRPSCVTKEGDPCCVPGQRPDDEQGLEDDCAPAGRRHRTGGDGQDPGAERIRSSDDAEDDAEDDADDGDAEGEDGDLGAGEGSGTRDGDGDDDGNDTGSSSFRRSRSGRDNGSARRVPNAAPSGGTSGAAPSGGTAGAAPAGGTAGSAPAGGTPSGAPAGSGATAGGTADPGGPSGATAAGSVSSAVEAPGAGAGRAPAGATASAAPSGAPSTGQPSQMANTGRNIATPVSLAMMLLTVGTTLRRATRLRPHRRPTMPGNLRPRRPPSPAAPPNWSYVDHSSTARAIEKF